MQPSFWSRPRLAAALAALALSLASPVADACNSTAQCMAPSVCNTTTHMCVGCIDNTPCRGPSPICDVQAGFCSSCNGDFGSANSLNCTAAHPVCVTSGSETGTCTDCSATNATACNTITRPVCAVSLGVCGCGSDADCNATTYCDHDVAPEGWCVFGCHVVGGVDRCPSGNHCDARDGTIGNCQPGMCGTDAECGATDSGKICAGGSCVDGCRGTGNGCPSPMICSSSDDSTGQCGTAPTPDAGTSSDASASADSSVDAGAPIIAPAGLGGCNCTTAQSRSTESGLAFAAIAALIAAMRARRAPARKRACATPPSPSSIPK